MVGITKIIEIDYCDEDYKNALIKPNARFLYPENPLCFKEQEKLQLKSNMLIGPDVERHVGYWIRYCLNSTENGNWCKPRNEIDLWLKEHNHAFIYEETRVNKDLWADSPLF